MIDWLVAETDGRLDRFNSSGSGNEMGTCNILLTELLSLFHSLRHNLVTLFLCMAGYAATVEQFHAENGREHIFKSLTMIFCPLLRCNFVVTKSQWTLSYAYEGGYIHRLWMASGISVEFCSHIIRAFAICPPPRAGTQGTIQIRACIK